MLHDFKYKTKPKYRVKWLFGKPELERVFLSVHDRHCCPIAGCGCKYGDEDCPVEQGREAGIPCEFCMYGSEGVYSFI